MVVTEAVSGDVGQDRSSGEDGDRERAASLVVHLEIVPRRDISQESDGTKQSYEETSYNCQSSDLKRTTQRQVEWTWACLTMLKLHWTTSTEAMLMLMLNMSYI